MIAALRAVGLIVKLEGDAIGLDAFPPGCDAFFSTKFRELFCGDMF